MYPPQQQNPFSWQQGAPPAPQQKSWWGRNWKWFVPTGCLGLVALLAAGVFAIVWAAFSLVKSTEVYRNALEMARANPEVVAELGEPIEDSWYVKGTVNDESGTGRANLEIPISGPRKSGTVYAVARRGDDATNANNWEYTLLEVEIEGRPKRVTIYNVLSPPAPDGLEGITRTPPEPTNVPPSATTAAPGTISAGVLNGKAVSKPEPTYPPVAKAAGASGTVTVMVVVDETGKVTSARAVAGHPLLQQAAVVAAKQAKFSPTLLAGKPVKVSGVLTYNFVLEQ